MRGLGAVIRDILREAASRKWLIALAVLITLALLTIAFALRLEVVDGALAASRLFGTLFPTDIRAADVAMRPLFVGAAYLIFYGGIPFMILACSDFGPSLLSPGRIELLLALPVRRWQLLVGTYVGVVLISAAAAAYGAGGLTVVIGVKTGVWTWRPLLAAALAVLCFATLYAAMLTAALFARSAALSAACGGLLFVLGILAGYRRELAELFDPGLGRVTFQGLASLFPRVSTLADLAGSIAGTRVARDVAPWRLAAGFVIYAGALLSLGIWRFEQKDF